MNDELFKAVEINGETYQIKKFSARDGLKIGRLVLAKVAPIIPYLSDGKEAAERKPTKAAKENEMPQVDMDDAALYKAVALTLDSLNDKDMAYLIDKCLRTCSKLLPAGPMPVIDENGYYGIPEVEYDMGLTISLVVEAIKWGASDFFDGKGFNLKALFKRIGK